MKSDVKVADNLADRVLVRDTKSRFGGVLAFTPYAWSQFLQAVKR